MGKFFEELFGSVFKWVFEVTGLNNLFSFFSGAGDSVGAAARSTTSSLSDSFSKANNWLDKPVSTQPFDIFKPAPGTDSFGDYIIGLITNIRAASFDAAPDPFTSNVDVAIDGLQNKALAGADKAVAGTKQAYSDTVNGFSNMFNTLGGAAVNGFPRGPASAGRARDNDIEFDAPDTQQLPPSGGGGRGTRASAIVTWGSSIAQGEGAALASKYPNVINLGRESAGLRASTKPMDYSGIPAGAAVLIDVGTNDVGALMNRGPEAAAEYADAVIRVAKDMKARGATPIIIGVQAPMDSNGNPSPYTENPVTGSPKWIGTMRDINAALASRARAEGIAWSPTEGRIPASERAADHLHYKKEGYLRIAQNALSDAGIELSGPRNSNNGFEDRGRLGNEFDRSARPKALDTPAPIDTTGLQGIRTVTREIGKEAQEILEREAPSWRGHPADALGRRIPMRATGTDADGNPVQLYGVITRHHHEEGYRGRNWGDGFAADGKTPDDTKYGWHNGVSVFMVKPSAGMSAPRNNSGSGTGYVPMGPP